MKKIFSLIFLVFLVATIGKGWHWAKDGFNILRVHPALPSGDETEPPASIAAVLDQPFTYLGRGHQCYAFESADGRVVLKLPRLDRYELPFWLSSCPLPFFEKYKKSLWSDISHRKDFILRSFQIALEELQEETGVLYLHLHQTRCFQKTVRLSDRVGRTYCLNLDRTPFILQEKKPLMMPFFSEALQRGDRKRAEEILDVFLGVISSRAEKGIFNKDPSFLRNFGFDGERGFQIDIGSFYHKQGMDAKESFAPSFRQTTALIGLWLAEIDPEMYKWFVARADEMMRDKAG